MTVKILLALFCFMVSGLSSAASDDVLLQQLLATELQSTPGTQVRVSRVSIPAHTSLPKHWHPGEEFAYLLDGEVTLWQLDKPEIAYKKGELVNIPAKQVHTAITGALGVELLIFRIHEKGQLERVLAAQ